MPLKIVCSTLIPWWLTWSGIWLQCRIPGFDSWSGQSPGEGNGYPFLVFLPGEFHGQRSLAGCSPWGCKELDTTEVTEQACMHLYWMVAPSRITFEGYLLLPPFLPDSQVIHVVCLSTPPLCLVPSLTTCHALERTFYNLQQKNATLTIY